MLFLLIRRFRWALLLAALASVVAGSSGVLLVTQINAALTSEATGIHRQAAIFAAAAVASLVATMFASIFSERLRQRANAELRRHIAAQVMSAPLRQIEQIGSPAVQSALSEHTASVSQFFVNMPVLLTNGVIVVGCLIYLTFLSPQVFLVTLPFVALGSVGYHLVHVRAITYLRSGAAEQDRLFSHFRALTDGAKELRLNRFKRRMFTDRVLGKSVAAVRDQRTKGMSLFVMASSWGNFLIYAFLGLVLFVMADADITARGRVLTGFALLIVYMVGPLQSLLMGIPNAKLARVAADRIEAITANMQSSEAVSTTDTAAPVRSIVLSQVMHRYYHERSNEVFQLGPVDLALHPGQITFLVGGNGSGKTTLAKLLAGLYAPEQGSILLNGSPVDDTNRDDYRQCVSAVFSDFHLFESLLEESRGELDARGNQLLSKLHLQHKVKLQAGRFTTLDLSQGQCKRLALVAACLEDRPVLLFDEWAADQDPAFKEIFYYEILREMRARGKAVLVISHDDRYFHVADRIVRMEDGRVVLC